VKKLYTFFIALFIATGVFAQAPERMSYQAVVRDQNSNLVTNQTIGLDVRIHTGSSLGPVVYIELHTVTTNENGLVSLEIGGGSPSEGQFSEIDWGSGPHYISTRVDLSGGTNFTFMGASQLLSVPYALYAKTTGDTVAGPMGPTGPQGIQGVQGEVGPTGAQGIQGEVGPTGAQGIQGIQGEVGPTGAQGLTGQQGVQGATGPTGAQGLIGEEGIQGATGPTGAQGIQGEVGPTGAQGIQGIPGDVGPTGAQGIQGPTGEQGVGIATTINNGNGTLTFIYSDASTFTTNNLTGPQGATGDQGIQGATGPTGAQGALVIKEYKLVHRS
jgi:hypothetical protein